MKVIKPPLIYQFEKAFSILFFSLFSYGFLDFIFNKQATTLDLFIFIPSLILFSSGALFNLFLLLNNYPKILIDDQYLIYLNMFQCKYIELNNLEYESFIKSKLLNIITIEDKKNKFTIASFGFLKSHLKLVEKELEIIITSRI